MYRIFKKTKSSGDIFIRRIICQRFIPVFKSSSGRILNEIKQKKRKRKFEFPLLLVALPFKFG